MRAILARALGSALLLTLLLAGVIPGAAAARVQPEAPAAPGRTFSVQVGAASPDHAVEAWQFYPATLTVDAGDTVIWTQNDLNELHTVTFLDQGKDVPFFVEGRLNPVGATPAGGTMYSGSGFVNSGVLKASQSYSLTFARPGTYQYFCLIHDELGMKATITVLPADPIALPRAGGIPGGEILLGLLGLGLIGAGLGLGRRTRSRA